MLPKKQASVRDGVAQPWRAAEQRLGALCYPQTRATHHALQEDAELPAESAESNASRCRHQGVNRRLEKALQPHTKEAVEAKLISTYHEGMVAFREGNLRDARKLFQTVVNETEEDGATAPALSSSSSEWVARGGRYAAYGMPARARRCMRQQKIVTLTVALKLRMLALRNLGEVYEICGKMEPSEALEKGCGFPPSEEGYTSSALQSYAEAVRIDSGMNVALLCRMGRLALDMGKHNVARRCFEHGLSLRPLHPLLPEMLMDVLQRIGDTYRSKIIARKVLRKKPNHAGAKRILHTLSDTSRKMATIDGGSDGIIVRGDDHVDASTIPADEVGVIEVHVGQYYCETWTDVIQVVLSKRDAKRRDNPHGGSTTTARCRLKLHRDIVADERTHCVTHGAEMPMNSENDNSGPTETSRGNNGSRLMVNARARDESAGNEFTAKNMNVGRNTDVHREDAAEAATVAAEAREMANTSKDTDAAARTTVNTNSSHENNKENKPALRQSTRQSARVKQAVLEDSSKECEHVEKELVPTPVVQLSEEAEKKLRPFADEMSQGESFGVLMVESCAAAMDVSSSRDSGSMRRYDSEGANSASRNGDTIRNEDMDTFVATYGSEWASLELFGAALLEFIAGGHVSCVVDWDEIATQRVMSLEHGLRHSASQSLPPRHIRTCLFAMELLLRDAENRITGTMQAFESAEGVAAGYLFNVGLIHAQIASGEIGVLSVDTETRMHRCASLWARINKRFQESMALMRMAKAVLVSPSASSEQANSTDNGERIVRLPHIHCEMSARSIDVELSEIQSDVLVESAKVKPALLQSSSFLGKFSGALFSRRYDSARDLLLSLANFRSDRVKVLDLLLDAAATADGDIDSDVPTRRFLTVAQLRAHMHTSMVHLLVVFGAERDGGGTTAKTSKQRTKDVPLWLSTFSGKSSALRSVLEKMNAYLDRLRKNDNERDIFREAVSANDGALLLEMKTLAAMLLEHFIRAWRDETTHKQGASTKLSVRTSGPRIAFTIFAESLLHLYESVLAQDTIDDDMKDTKLRNLFAALQDCLGSINVCTARDCSFLRLGVSMLRKKLRSTVRSDDDRDKNEEDDAAAVAEEEEEEEVDSRADPIDQAIYSMLGIPLCRKDRLVENHGITHQKLRATKEGTYVSDPGYLPPASVAIDVWEHLDHFMDCVADEERCSKKKEDVCLTLSPTLELIAPHVKEDMDSISEKLREYMDSDALEDNVLEESTVLSFADDAPPSLTKLKATYFTALWECRDTLDPLEATDSRRLLKDGVEDIVERATCVVRADIVFNPRRFKSWSILGRLYDVAADILINDGSKLVPLSQWWTGTADGMTFGDRAELYKRRCLRCWKYAYKLASKHSEFEEVWENMALLHFEKSQNVHPVYSQRGAKRTVDSYWSHCVESKHFFSLLDEGDPGNWFFSFHLGKLAYKMNDERYDVLTLFAKACKEAPECLETFYRLHATRLKYLLAVDADGRRRAAKESLEKGVLQRHMFYRSWEDICHDIENGSGMAGHIPTLVSDECVGVIAELGEAGRMVLNDCVLAMERCLEVSLYYKARFRLARTYVSLGAPSMALDILAFLFKNKAGSFDVNMYEIGDDIVAKRELVRMKSSRKQMLIKTFTGQSVEMKGDLIRNIGIEETGRKYVSAVRRILVFYLRLCCELEELDVLASATTWLRSDRSKLRQFLEDDIGPMAEAMYLHVLRVKSSSTSSSFSVQERSACYTMYVNAYMNHSSPSQHFSTMATAMEVAIRNGEISWPISTSESEPSCVGREHGLTEISIEGFLSENAFAYVSALESSDEILALLSSLHDNCSVERMQPLLSPSGLVHHIIYRILVTCSEELGSESASTSSVNRRLVVQEVLVTCKAVRDFYLKYVVFGTIDIHTGSADNPVVTAIEDLMIRAFRMCENNGLHSAESGHGENGGIGGTRAEDVKIVISFCDTLPMTKMRISPIKRPQPSTEEEPLSNPSRGEEEARPPSPKRTKRTDGDEDDRQLCAEDEAVEEEQVEVFERAVDNIM